MKTCQLPYMTKSGLQLANLSICSIWGISYNTHKQVQIHTAVLRRLHFFSIGKNWIFYFANTIVILQHSTLNISISFYFFGCMINSSIPKISVNSVCEHVLLYFLPEGCSLEHSLEVSSLSHVEYAAPPLASVHWRVDQVVSSVSQAQPGYHRASSCWCQTQRWTAQSPLGLGGRGVEY